MGTSRLDPHARAQRADSWIGAAKFDGMVGAPDYAEVEVGP